MTNTTLLTQTLRIFGWVCLIDLISIGLVAGIGWWAGWLLEDQFKAAVQLAGLLIFGIGIVGLMGKRNNSRTSEEQPHQALTDKTSRESPHQVLLDFSLRYSFFITMFVAGLLCLIIGWLM